MLLRETDIETYCFKDAKMQNIHKDIHTYIYIYIYIIYRESIYIEYITQENDGKKYIYIYIDIYENLKSPYISSLTC